MSDNIRVFIPQLPCKIDKATRTPIPTINLGPAQEYGELVHLIPVGINSPIIQPMVNRMKNSLQSFTDDDYILAVGGPTPMGVAIALAAKYNRGKCKVLVWDRVDHRYYVQQINIG